MTTTNIGLAQPAHNSDTNTWDSPLNANFGIIDNLAGGETVINVTGVLGSSSPIALTQTQLTPRLIRFVGTLGANLLYQVPSGIGGLWSVFNNTTGAPNVLQFGVAGGNSLTPTPQQTSLIECYGGGTAVTYGDSNALAAATTAQTNAQAFATAAVNGTTGTFTAVGIGGLGNATMTYLIVGNFCTLSLLGGSQLIGTISGATGFNGLPAQCQPSSTYLKYLPCSVINNGQANVLGQAVISNSGTVTLRAASTTSNGVFFGSFQPSATGGLAQGWTITYPLQ
jgi:hypothetical protein